MQLVLVFLMKFVGSIVLVQREMEFSGSRISYCSSGSSASNSRYRRPQLLPTACLCRARQTGAPLRSLGVLRRPAQQIPRGSESAVALSAG